MLSPKNEKARQPVFYAPPGHRSGDLIELPRSESHHALKVMRVKRGEIVVVVDGCGVAYRGEISGIVVRETVQVRIHAELRNFGEPLVRLQLAAGLSSVSKFDSLVQKGTELGVTRFVPLICRTAKVKLDDPKKAAARVRRLQKVALAAIKQCRRSLLPEITLPMTFDDLLLETDADSVNVIFHPSTTGTGLQDVLVGTKAKRVSILVGPESGFTSDEEEAAVEAGYRTVSLGPRILRTETAGPVACALVMSLLGELR
ncbi:MAG: 16S rRNA (uracil(1498)-N(3))-methyltransferase [candidate division Zixibacteria bacterium]|nr:16S rRNA (uracil(1498)-N(3))-methyltransferase [candidate division Zixibacteria bacterium]